MYFEFGTLRRCRTHCVCPADWRSYNKCTRGWQNSLNSTLYCHLQVLNGHRSSCTRHATTLTARDGWSLRCTVLLTMATSAVRGHNSEWNWTSGVTSSLLEQRSERSVERYSSARKVQSERGCSMTTEMEAKGLKPMPSCVTKTAFRQNLSL